MSERAPNSSCAAATATAARIGPAQGVQTTPRAMPVTSPPPNPVEVVSTAPGRIRPTTCDVHASTRSLATGTRNISPMPTSSATAAQRSPSPTDPAADRMAVRATRPMLKVVMMPSTRPSERRRSPVADTASRAGSSGSTHGVSTETMPARKATAVTSMRVRMPQREPAPARPSSHQSPARPAVVPQARRVSPRYPSGPQPGGSANTADPIGVVHVLNRSFSASRCWMGTNWVLRSAA